jgi:hypothetical protein
MGHPELIFPLKILYQWFLPQMSWQFSLRSLVLAAVFGPPLLAAGWFLAVWLQNGGETWAIDPLQTVGYGIAFGAVTVTAVVMAGLLWHGRSKAG